MAEIFCVIIFGFIVFLLIVWVCNHDTCGIPRHQTMSDQELFKLYEADLKEWSHSDLYELLKYADFRQKLVCRRDKEDYDFGLSLKWGQLYRRTHYALYGYYEN